MATIAFVLVYITAIMGNFKGLKYVTPYFVMEGKSISHLKHASIHLVFKLVGLTQ